MTVTTYDDPHVSTYVRFKIFGWRHAFDCSCGWKSMGSPFKRRARSMWARHYVKEHNRES